MGRLKLKLGLIATACASDTAGKRAQKQCCKVHVIEVPDFEIAVSTARSRCFGNTCVPIKLQSIVTLLVQSNGKAHELDGRPFAV